MMRKMKMADIDKRCIIDDKNLSSEHYFSLLLKESRKLGLLEDSDMTNIQLQCIELLAYKVERYNSGDSSSIRVETAESIMKSNFYTMGVYLKSLQDTGHAVSQIKTSPVSLIYQKGRKLINAKIHAAKHIYRMIQGNKLTTINYAYNATVSHNGVGSFFELYNPEYEAHETIASIDYQICNTITGLAGVEYILKYLENIFLENQFCRNFAAEDIHHLLCGYDEGYKDLLINIFEQVLAAALGCVLANRSVLKLDISGQEVEQLYSELCKDDDNLLIFKIHNAAEKIFKEADISSIPLQRYIKICLPQITATIINAVREDTLDKVFVCPVNPDMRPKVRFSSGAKMRDEDYRKFIGELHECRYSSDKSELIKEKVKSFGDFEDLLLDGKLSQEEMLYVFDILGNGEIAALIKRHPFQTFIQAVDLSEDERVLRIYLKRYFNRLKADRQEHILEVMERLIDN
ncbi:hypothetical protein OXPF_08090 [Oxobacter pfennigii]|uniref:Uncharacterized protein n=1 Tax=Oxobacter pfennigii TaxID=36849 RepID=A0A0N8NTR6_9CLOT|nr:DUF6179 domain-containing protein [Oxobacter pfennigii]KPU45576.1 hypothetical protein OXPF_08090 [Oxobacter pfennigii]